VPNHRFSQVRGEESGTAEEVEATGKQARQDQDGDRSEEGRECRGGEAVVPQAEAARKRDQRVEVAGGESHLVVIQTEKGEFDGTNQFYLIYFNRIIL